MIELHFQPVVSLTVAIGAAAILLALLLVRPRHVRLNRRQAATLIGLRFVVVLLLLFALLRPSLVTTKVEPVRASLVMLVDHSRSMQVADSLGDKSRWEAVRLLLDAAADDLAKLASKGDVTAYQFSEDSTPVEVSSGRLALDSSPNGESTAIGAALGDALDREVNKRVSAVLLLSDGAQRTAPPRETPPHVAARRLVAENIPLYTFTFGKSGGSERADLSLSDLLTNESVFSETPTDVRALLSAEGYASQRVKVQLLWETPRGMEAVDTQQVETGSQGGATPIALRYTPREPGEYKVTVRVEPRAGELITTNNEASTFVRVRPGGINVLYLVGAQRVGGGAGPEQRFVRAALARSPDIVVTRRLINYDPMGVDITELVGSPTPLANAASGIPRGTPNARANPLPDVVVLDNVDSQGLNAASWQAIAQRVERGMGLIMTGGYHSFGPGGFRGSQLANVLPVEIGPAQRQAFGETPRHDVQLAGPLRIRPTAPLGLKHPIMQLSATGSGNLRNPTPAHAEGSDGNPWPRLPPLDGANRIERTDLKPNAQVLAEADDPQRHPLLVVGQAGEGRVLAFAGDSTWRWVMAGFGEAHRRFWRQGILWLAKKDERTEGKVWIELASRRAARGARVDFKLGAETPQGQPAEGTEFTVNVLTPEGKSEPVQPTKSSEGWTAAYRGATKPGDYRIVVTAKSNGTELGKAEARFLVPNQDVELDRPAAEPTLMAQLAAMTQPAGGAALAAEELPDLLKRLAAQPPDVKQEVVAKITYWDTWPFFLTFVGLLAAEWFLRKRWGLV
ncbi:MAG: hypothetical protein IT425_10040 [Pirellulales bacterium]|nr:hypothetical protein [Pirellulales bacterium]